MSISISLAVTKTITDKGLAKLKIVATGTDITSKVFAIEVIPATATASEQYAFSHICSPAELIEMPDGATTTASYFRTNDIEFLFDTVTPMEEVLKCITGDVRRLVKQLNQLTNMATSTSTVTIS